MCSIKNVNEIYNLIDRFLLNFLFCVQRIEREREKKKKGVLKQTIFFELNRLCVPMPICIP